MTIDRSDNLVFLGNLMAMISHELKNRLAVIKEHNGLLSDWVGLAIKGERSLDFERLHRLSEAVAKQVALADQVVTNMNRIAHSMDELYRSTEITDLLRLIADVSKRFAYLYRKNLEVSIADAPQTVRTSPFFLIHLFWLFIEKLVTVDDEPGTIVLKSEKTDDGGVLIQLAAPKKLGAALLMSERMKNLADAIKADVECRNTEKIILVRLPANLSDDNEQRYP